MRNSKRVKIVAGGTALLMGTGIAFAYWTSDGTGEGSATTGDAVVWDVTTDAAVGDDLSPDGPTQTVDFHVQNDNLGTQRLEGVTVTVANPDGTAWNSGSCSAADYAITQHTVPAGSDVLAGDTYTGQISIQMVDTGSNQDDCKNASVPLYVVAQ